MVFQFTKRVWVTCLILLGGVWGAMAVGTWIPVTNSAPLQADTMLLLSDGTVMMTAGENTSGGSGWARLVPDAHGSYANGTWYSVASMHDTRLYFSSDVLVNGQVFVAGGEYGTGRSTAEVYDPAGNAWTRVNGGPGFGTNGAFSDSISKMLPDGNVMVMPLANNGVPFGSTALFNFAANDFQIGGAVHGVFGQDEASWVKLSDGSILTVDPYGAMGTNSERYIPALNQWVVDSGVPVRLYDNDGELGPAFLLPNGNAVFFGASGHTAIYTPSGTTNAGSWVAGPDMPNGVGMPDAPGAMMANGKILCATGVPNTLAAPTAFCEYDYTANAFTVVSNPVAGNYPPFVSRMLDLPDGTVLYSYANAHLYIYRPDGIPVATGKPVINGVTTNSDGSFQLAGTQLNGISDGAAYGDDAQMDSSYPIIYVTNGTSVYYFKTFNWSSTRVMTGTNVVMTDFTVPTNVPAGTYSLFVSANGISSDPMAFSVGPVTTNPATIYLTNSDAALTSSFNTGLNWSDGQVPVGQNNYVVSGFDLRTPSVPGEMTTFRGGSLYLTNGGALRLQNSASGDTATIGAPPGRVLVVDGGTISDWAGQPETVGGYIVLGDNGNVIDPQNTVLTLGGNISGNGSLTVDSPNGVVGGTVLIPRPASYSGATIINAADTLQLMGTGTPGSTNSPLVFSNTLAHGYGTLDLNGLNQAIPNVSGTGGSIINSAITATVLTIGLSNSTAVIGNGGGAFGGRILSSTVNPISLIKDGSGTFTLTGNSTLASLSIGPTNNGTVMTNGSLVVSGGALAVGNGAGDSLSVAGGGITGTSQGTLDVSGASGFSANVGNIQVGVGLASGAGCAGSFLLGTNNSIVSSTSVIIGDYTAVAQTTTLQSMSTAANGVTTISTPVLIVGARRCAAAFTLGQGSQLNLGSTSARTSMSVGHAGLYGLNTTGNIALSGLADFSGGELNADLNSLVIGTKSSNAGSGSETGTMLISANPANHLDITGAGNVVLIGTNYTTGTSAATGVLTISNLDATSVIASTDNSAAVVIGANTKATGTLNLDGGTLTITTTGAGITGGTGTSTLNLGGVTLKAGASTTSFITSIGTATLNTGGVTFDTAGYSINVAQTFNGAGGITKSDAGVLTLSMTNGYTGNTVVLAGTLALSGPGSCAGSALMDVLNGATLDASGRTDQTLTVGGAQILKGGGNVMGNLNALAGSVINPGDAIGTLTVSSNITLAGTLVLELNRTNLPANDELVSTGGGISGGGILMVTNLGQNLVPGDHFQLFNSAVSGFGTVNLPALASGSMWMNKVAVDGSIQVVPAVSTAPTNITVLVSGKNVTLNWPPDHTGWRLQSQSNSLAGTNWADIPGASLTNKYIFTVDPSAADVFFRLVYP